MDSNNLKTTKTNLPSAYQFWKLMSKLTKLANLELKQKRASSQQIKQA